MSLTITKGKEVMVFTFSNATITKNNPTDNINLLFKMYIETSKYDGWYGVNSSDFKTIYNNFRTNGISEFYRLLCLDLGVNPEIVPLNMEEELN